METTRFAVSTQSCVENRALSLNADVDGALHAEGSRIIAAGVGQAIAAQFAEESPGSAEQGAR
jgi:hypothetical protein